MSVASILADVCLGAAVLVVVASAVGVLVMRDVYQKLHFLTPISIVAPLLVAAAVTLREGWHANTGQTWLAVALVCVASPILGHATMRAARVRDRGDWRDREGVRQAAEGT